MHGRILPPLNTRLKRPRLLAALSTAGSQLPLRMSKVQIELDLTNGVGNVFIGGSNVSSTHCGRHLVPAQFENIAVIDTGIVLTNEIFLSTDSNNNQINVICVPIGM